MFTEHVFPATPKFFKTKVKSYVRVASIRSKNRKSISPVDCITTQNDTTTKTNQGTEIKKAAAYLENLIFQKDVNATLNQDYDMTLVERSILQSTEDEPQRSKKGTFYTRTGIQKDNLGQPPKKTKITKNVTLPVITSSDEDISAEDVIRDSSAITKESSIDRGQLRKSDEDMFAEEREIRDSSAITKERSIDCGQLRKSDEDMLTEEREIRDSSEITKERSIGRGQLRKPEKSTVPITENNLGSDLPASWYTMSTLSTIPSDPTTERRTHCGFENPIGTNKCWMNASLQAILNMSTFTEDIMDFLENSITPGRSSSQMLKHFIGMIKAKKSCNKDHIYYAASKFYNSLSILNPNFPKHLQQDAAEFICLFFTALTEELDRLRKSTDLKNPVYENVTFKIKEVHTCIVCSQFYSKEIRNNVYNVHIGLESTGLFTIQDGIEQSVSQERVEQRCNTCDSNESDMRLEIIGLPKFLIIQLNRFHCKDGKIEKVCNKVRVSNMLTLRKLVSKEQVEVPYSSGLIDREYRYNYRLVTTISHFGSDTTSGHYIADIYDMKERVWIRYNDDIVHERSREIISKDGYIFVYMYYPLFMKSSVSSP